MQNANDRNSVGVDQHNLSVIKKVLFVEVYAIFN